MTDRKQKSDEMKATLDELNTRVSAAREANKPKPSRGFKEVSTYGIATRLVAELIAGILVGVLFGWYLDQWLDTKPWLMILLIVIGAAAGIMNVMRAAKQLAPKFTHNEEDD
ncbi:MAG: AtpZ/AtpI family protein [Emcibacteraceae bacterium]|nr:AtpZ/AtpI family protein [Emcibacteraceae bacterium]MDG1995598.1 AtpZ/AtpI family protein [Emcibacteraceae bacterium]